MYWKLTNTSLFLIVSSFLIVCLAFEKGTADFEPAVLCAECSVLLLSCWILCFLCTFWSWNDNTKRLQSISLPSVIPVKENINKTTCILAFLFPFCYFCKLAHIPIKLWKENFSILKNCAIVTNNFSSLKSTLHIEYEKK